MKNDQNEPHILQGGGGVQGGYRINSETKITFSDSVCPSPYFKGGLLWKT